MPRPPRATPGRLLDRLRRARSDVAETREDTRALLALATELREQLAVQDQRLHALQVQHDELRGTLAEHRERLLLAARVVRDDDAGRRAELLALRATPEYAAAFDDEEPLVSVVIPTYNRWQLLRDRSLPSVLAQSYTNWECIVVGDAAPDETREVVESLGDERVQFVNLPYRGPYPDDPTESWMVSGTMPWNTGCALARGRWIASNADDDALRPKCIETLLAHARRERAEVAYGYIDKLVPGGPDERLGTFPPQYGQWGIQASLLHAGLRFLPLQPSDWVFGIPNDMSLMQRMLRLGVRFSLVEETVVEYYASQLWPEGRD